MKIIGVIPARYKSSRFPGKPLVNICDKPMIWWVYQQALKVPELDEVYVATDGEFIGSILNFVANKEDVNSIYYYFNNQIIHMPKLSLNMSKTKLKILKTLQDGDQTAILIGKNVSISRSMVYKHINSLMEEGLVAQRKQYEKFYLTDAGRMLII